jgi:phosphoribosylformimino-5-aminoimidazole carboxamide ribotide isomerase
MVLPSLDLTQGRAVRLEQGDLARQKAYATDADEVVALARRLTAAGAQRLHLVDLDAALGLGDNRGLVERLVAEVAVEVQVAGGVRSLAGAERWLASGAAAVVMGTAAARKPELLVEVATAHPSRVLAALDVRGGRPAVRGWSATEDVGVPELLRRWEEAPLAGVVVTSVDRDGTLGGPDLRLLAIALAASSHRVIYSGGIASVADLEALAAAGAAGVILGKSLLEGLIPLGEALSFSAPR